MKLYLFILSNGLRFYANEKVGIAIADRLCLESDGRVTITHQAEVKPVESVEAFFAPTDEVEDETP